MIKEVSFKGYYTSECLEVYISQFCDYYSQVYVTRDDTQYLIQ